LASAVAVDRWLAGQATRLQRAGSSGLRRQLPEALELMAAALSAGATTPVAVVLAAQGVGAPLRGPLLEVATSLRLGAGPEEAWSPTMREQALRPLGRLALRSTASGAAMAGACRELAGQVRAGLVVEAQVAIKRAGVLSVLPMALCFLPAFVLVGVVPMIVGLLRTLQL
jgi:Flp pilus assembly protein TadB